MSLARHRCVPKLLIWWLTYASPECWNGKDLDSVDHKSHVTYAVNGVCAAGTVALPRIDMLVRYPAQANVAELAMSSGSIYSMHADFFNASGSGSIWSARRSHPLTILTLSVSEQFRRYGGCFWHD
jgi:hypothetical protein